MTPPEDHRSRLRLLPVERSFAAMMEKRQRNHPNDAIRRGQENYGPEGMRLLSAAIVMGLVAGLLGVAGVATLALGQGQARAESAGQWLLASAIIVAIGSMARSLQGIRRGRSFRGSRPFAKRT